MNLALALAFGKCRRSRPECQVFAIHQSIELQFVCKICMTFVIVDSWLHKSVVLKNHRSTRHYVAKQLGQVTTK